MSKKTPGRWDCDGKPEDAHFGLIDTALERINAATSPYAKSMVHTQGPYNPNASFQPDLEQPNFSARTAEGREVDFEDIKDDSNYHLAQELYYAEPEDSVKIEDTLFHLFPRDLAVLRVEAHRSLDLVDIETFRSRRDMEDYWDDVLGESEDY